MLLDLIKVAVITLTIDYLYLNNIGAKPFMNMVNTIQNEKSNVKYYSAVIAYILIILMIYKYVINLDNYYDAFLLGCFTYGIFDFTNLALFNKYDLKIAIQDTIWGGVLYTIILYIFNWINTFSIIK